jgi:branched-chain amino acid transport system substrate-binding protein
LVNSCFHGSGQKRIRAYADTIKVGVVGPFSGPFALQGKNFKAGIDAYMAMNGMTRSATTPSKSSIATCRQADPAQSKALAQELVVKEKVQYLAGFYFTPMPWLSRRSSSRQRTRWSS